MNGYPLGLYFILFGILYFAASSFFPEVEFYEHIVSISCLIVGGLTLMFYLLIPRLRRLL